MRPSSVVRGAAAAAAVLLAAFLGCSSGPSAVDPCPGDDAHTIGEYCDRLLPAFCKYAVDVCGAAGTVDECFQASRATCCQGGCSRKACTALEGDISACILAYAGEDAGVPDARGASGPLDCRDVSDGFAPRACRNIVQLKSGSEDHASAR